MGREEASKFVRIWLCSQSSNTCSYSSIADSVHVTVGWLRILLVGDHFLLQADENLLHRCFPGPLLKEGELACFDGTVALVDRGNVNLGGKSDLGHLLRVVWTALDLEEVDSAVEVGVGWPDYRTIPIGEALVVTLVKAVGD